LAHYCDIVGGGRNLLPFDVLQGQMDNEKPGAPINRQNYRVSYTRGVTDQMNTRKSRAFERNLRYVHVCDVGQPKDENNRCRLNFIDICPVGALIPAFYLDRAARVIRIPVRGVRITSALDINE
jgi:hypothetical protein